MIKFPFVLKDEAEAEAFVLLVAGHYFNLMVATGEKPNKRSADALGHALRKALNGEPDE